MGWMSFAFRTASGIRSIHDVRGVRIWADGGENFPLLRESELSQRARRWLLVAAPLSKSLIERGAGESEWQSPVSS